VRKLIIGLVCLIGVGVLADFTAAAYAEYRVSRAVRAGADLTNDPEVTFHGFPFLAQVADGNYRDIEIRAREVRPESSGGDLYVAATLHDVHMPLRHLMDGSVRTVTAGDVDARMWLDSTKLGKVLGIPDLQVSTSPADKSDGSGGSGGSGMTTTGGAIVLMATLPVSPDVGTLPVGGVQGDGDALATMPRQRVSVKARVTLTGDELRIVATNLYSGSDSGQPDTPVPAQYLPAVLARFTRDIPIEGMPFQLAPTKVLGEGGQIVVEGTAHDAHISLDQLQGAAPVKS
jgi:hypothetical protein